VGWLTGDIADPRLGSSGVPLILDGAQGIGAVAVDPRALGCIAYAGAGQKWLCGADGTGMLWIDPDAGLRAFGPGYAAFEDTTLGLESGIRSDASRFDASSIALEVTTASIASTELLAGFGWDDIFARAHVLAASLASELAERGRVVGPRGETTLVGWQDDDPEATAGRLAESGIAIRYLPGTRWVRASVGAWNDESDLERLLAAL
jgi:L-cysteine/cystine lyase